MTQKPPDLENKDTNSERAGPKERVLHTRVPLILEEELKRLAGSLKLPVSNLVRAILEDAIGAMDSVGRRAEGELRHVAQRLSQERDRLRHLYEDKTGTEVPQAEQVLGYQPLVLAAANHCARCGRDLPVGEQAYLAITVPASAKAEVIGIECLPATKK